MVEESMLTRVDPLPDQVGNDEIYAQIHFAPSVKVELYTQSSITYSHIIIVI